MLLQIMDGGKYMAQRIGDSVVVVREFNHKGNNHCGASRFTEPELGYEVRPDVVIADRIGVPARSPTLNSIPRRI